MSLSLLSFLAAPHLQAADDAPPVDTKQMMETLRALQNQQAAQAKAIRASSVQQANAGAASSERAATMWEEAVRTVQFGGRPGSDFREWKDGDGQALNDSIVKNAARLQFQWLSLTLQRSSGVPVKDLLPSVLSHTKDLLADETAITALEARIVHEKELANGKHGAQRKDDGPQVKKMHDAILKTPLPANPVAKWLKVTDGLNVADWENNPGELDGIYDQIVLPVFRDLHDPKLIEYWDAKLKRQADAATATRNPFAMDQFNNFEAPRTRWKRAADLLVIGQKNRALSEMLAIIKNFPGHPDAAQWIAALELALKPGVTVAPAASPNP